MILYSFEYPPVAYGGGGGGGNGQWCFTDDMTVELIDGTTKRMDELEKRVRHENIQSFHLS